jgi:hypothetical protein
MVGVPVSAKTTDIYIMYRERARERERATLVARHSSTLPDQVTNSVYLVCCLKSHIGQHSSTLPNQAPHWRPRLNKITIYACVDTHELVRSPVPYNVCVCVCVCPHFILKNRLIKILLIYIKCNFATGTSSASA